MDFYATWQLKRKIKFHLVILYFLWIMPVNINRSNLLVNREFGIIYNCAYTPELNPIELAFCKIKNMFRA